METDFLTPRELAEARRVSRRTIDNWLAAGLPHIRQGPKRGRILIPRKVLYVDTNRWPEIQKELSRAK